MPPQKTDYESEIAAHLRLVDYHNNPDSAGTNNNDLQTAPLFSSLVLRSVSAPAAVFPQYGLLGIRLETYGGVKERGEDSMVKHSKAIEGGNSSDGEAGTERTMSMARDSLLALVRGVKTPLKMVIRAMWKPVEEETTMATDNPSSPGSSRLERSLTDSNATKEHEPSRVTNNEAEGETSPQPSDNNAIEVMTISDSEEPHEEPAQTDKQWRNAPQNSLIYANTNAPWSAFICGSQGSGKSHTLSCMLENSLVAPSTTGNNAAPLTALVLHYDKFTGLNTGQLCEAAYLCSGGIPVRVLVSPSNYPRAKALYENLPGLSGSSKRPQVIPLKFSNRHLSIGMMKSLMAVATEGSPPLYMGVVSQILREMAEADEPFDFIKFKTKICLQGWVSGQATPLEMRLRLLESFLDIDKSSIPQLRESSRKPPRNGQKPTNGPSPSSPPSAPRKKLKVDNGTAWDFGPGSLTIVDLSCPFVDESDACALFNIVLNIFLDGRTAGGRIIALDEAHKFLKSGNVQAKNLTETMLSIIRQQRHLAARVIIATQEPTLAPSLLDLCNVTIVHRFSSPAWYKTLHGHLASAVGRNIGSKDDDEDIFAKVVRLKTGEALVFCPAAVLDGKLWCFGSKYWFESRDMGTRYFKMKVRHRVTADGGKSIMASN